MAKTAQVGKLLKHARIILSRRAGNMRETIAAYQSVFTVCGSTPLMYNWRGSSRLIIGLEGGYMQMQDINSPKMLKKLKVSSFANGNMQWLDISMPTGPEITEYLKMIINEADRKP